MLEMDRFVGNDPVNLIEPWGFYKFVFYWISLEAAS